MNTIFLSMLVKPLVVLAIFGAILIPARLAVMRWMRNGRLKDILLTRLD